MASAIMNPPMKRKMMSSAYGAAASPMSLTPKNGNNTIGSSAVAASGRASVTHQIAMRTATAAVILPWSARLSGRSRKTATASTGPSAIPIQCLRGAAPGDEFVASLLTDCAMTHLHR